MSRNIGSKIGGRRGPGWRRKLLPGKNRRPDKPGLRRLEPPLKIVAVASLVLALIIFSSILPRRSGPEQSPPPDKPPQHVVERMEKDHISPFFRLLLSREIPGMEPSAGGQALIHGLLCTTVCTLTGIDPGNPCSVLDLELGAGRRIALPALTPIQIGDTRGVDDDAAVQKAEGPNPGSSPGGSLFPISGHDEAKILLYHTHASETFIPGTGTASGATPTVVTTGVELARILEEDYGLPVLHHHDIYDQPRRDAYKAARPAIEKIIAENPGLELVIDLHRDGVPRSRTTAIVDNRELASILLVHGRRNPGARKNLELVICLRDELETLLAPLSRGIMQQDFIYNQDLHPYAILLEIGGHENSIDEAMRSLPYLAEAIARTYHLFFLQDGIS